MGLHGSKIATTKTKKKGKKICQSEPAESTQIKLRQVIFVQKVHINSG